MNFRRLEEDQEDPMTPLAAALDEKVLVLNRLYTAVRITSARRAFVMLCKRVAEVIAVEDGRYTNYDLDSWIAIAQLQKQFEPDSHTWVRTPHFDIAVPKIIRLFGYDRLPRQDVKLNRRNLYARDSNPVVTLRLGNSKYQSWKAFLNEAYWTVELRD
jgi:hypothetical protein